MKLLILALLTATSFAGTIVPNIKWNKIEKNNTGAAAAWGERSNVTLSTDRSSASDSWQFGAQVLASYAGAAIEAGAKVFPDGFDNQVFDINVGYMVMPNLSVGLEYNYHNFDADGLNPDMSRPSLSLGYKVNDAIVVGAGFGRHHVNGSAVSSNQIHLGVGYITKDSTDELVLHYDLEDEDTATTSLSPSKWEIEFEHVCHGMLAKGLQMAAVAKVGKVDTTGADTTWSVQPELEYMAASHFFPGVFGGYSDQGGTTDGTWNAGASLRNVHDNFQWLAKAGWSEGDNYKFDLDLSYMF